LTGAGREHVTAGGPDALHNLAHLLDSFTLAENDLRESLSQPTVMIDLRKSEVLVGQVPEDLQPFFRGRSLMMDIF
jgi:hypothetical protein